MSQMLRTFPGFRVDVPRFYCRKVRYNAFHQSERAETPKRSWRVSYGERSGLVSRFSSLEERMEDAVMLTQVRSYELES